MSRRNRSSGSSEAQFFRSLGSGVFELTPGSRSTRQRTGLLVEAEQLQDAAVPEDAEGVGDIVMHSAQEAELLAENERNPFSVPQVRAQEEVVIIEAEDEAPSSDGGDSKHWVTHFLQAVPLQRNLLSDRAQTANANKSMAACMWQCTVPDILFTGSGKHCEYLVYSVNRPINTNIIDHFKTHSSLKKHMEDAKMRGLDLATAARNGLQMLEAQAAKNQPKNIMSYLARQTPAEKAVLELIPRERMELSLCFWSLEKQLAPAVFSGQSWQNLQKQFNISVPTFKTLTLKRYPVVYRAVCQVQQEIVEQAGFFHVDFDFITTGVKTHHALIVCFETCASDYFLFRGIAGLVYFQGFAGAEHVAQQVELLCNRRFPGAVVIASATVDGALRAAANELVGEENTTHCFAHQLDLVVKRSVDLERNGSELDLVPKDMSMMHHTGVFIRSRAAELSLFNSFRAKILGPGSELALLKDCLTRWESEHRKLKRFLLLSESLTQMSQSEDSDLFPYLTNLTLSGSAPPDCFRRSFWQRLMDIEPTISKLHQLSKLLQGATFVVSSSIPFWIHEMFLFLDIACINVDFSDAVVRWHKNLRTEFHFQFDQLFCHSNLLLCAAALDPRWADLSVMGVNQSVIDSVWARIEAEHRLLNLSGDDVDPDELLLGKTHVRIVLKKLLTASNLFITSLNAKTVKVDDAAHAPLQYWAAQASKPKGQEAWLAVSSTARMIFSHPGNSAESERGGGRIRRSDTPKRNSMDEFTLEKELVCAQFMATEKYSPDALIVTINKMMKN